MLEEFDEFMALCSQWLTVPPADLTYKKEKVQRSHDMPLVLRESCHFLSFLVAFVVSCLGLSHACNVFSCLFMHEGHTFSHPLAQSWLWTAFLNFQLWQADSAPYRSS